jgi:hypothetical protein
MSGIGRHSRCESGSSTAGRGNLGSEPFCRARSAIGPSSRTQSYRCGACNGTRTLCLPGCAGLTGSPRVLGAGSLSRAEGSVSVRPPHRPSRWSLRRGLLRPYPPGWHTTSSRRGRSGSPSTSCRCQSRHRTPTCCWKTRGIQPAGQGCSAPNAAAWPATAGGTARAARAVRTASSPRLGHRHATAEARAQRAPVSNQREWDVRVAEDR